MRRLLKLTCAVLLLLTTGCSSKTVSTTTEITQATGKDAGWVSVKSSVDRFAIEFPVRPKELKPGQFVANTEAGLVYKMGFSLVKPRPDPEKALRIVQKNMVAGLQGQVLKDEEISLGKWPGRAFSVANKRVSHIRLYYANDHLFTLMVAGDADHLSEDDKNKFFDSFSLLQEP